MKANELRIGNYIKQIKYLNGDCNEFRKVASVNKEGFLNVEVLGGDTMKSHPIEWFVPISISEEILLKCGYKFYNGKTEGDLCMDFGGKLDIDFINEKIQVKSHYEEYSMYRPIYEIKYLHQLQNLYFALTGTELDTSKIL